MKNIFLKTFGGLTISYYIREFLFGLIFLVIPFYLIKQSSIYNFQEIFFLIITQLLYPYSRFVYHSITGYLLGDNVFIGNAIFMLVIKFIMMLFCFSFAIFIAPIGLAYLYYYHSKEEKKYLEEQESLTDNEK